MSVRLFDRRSQILELLTRARALLAPVIASSGNTSMDPWARPFARLREDKGTHGSGPGLRCKPEASGKDEASSPQEPTVASSPGGLAFALAGSGTCCPRVSEASAPTKASPAPANIALR